MKPRTKRSRIIKPVMCYQVFHRNDMTPVVLDDHMFVVSPEREYLQYHWPESTFIVLPMESRVRP